MAPCDDEQPASASAVDDDAEAGETPPAVTADEVAPALGAELKEILHEVWEHAGDKQEPVEE